MFKKISLGLMVCIGMMGALSASHSSGPNHWQTAPKLQSATQKGARTQVKGTLDSVKNSSFMIQFFNNPTKTNNTQGLIYLGEIRVQTDEHGHASFKTLLSATSYDPAYISATATRLHHSVKLDTSEFSKNVKVK